MLNDKGLAGKLVVEEFLGHVPIERHVEILLKLGHNCHSNKIEHDRYRIIRRNYDA